MLSSSTFKISIGIMISSSIIFLQHSSRYVSSCLYDEDRNGEALGNLVQLEVQDNQKTLFRIHSVSTIHQLQAVKNLISEFPKSLPNLTITLYVIISVYSVLSICRYHFSIFLNFIVITIIHILIFKIFFSLNAND